MAHTRLLAARLSTMTQLSFQRNQKFPLHLPSPTSHHPVLLFSSKNLSYQIAVRLAASSPFEGRQGSPVSRKGSKVRQQSQIQPSSCCQKSHMNNELYRCYTCAYQIGMSYICSLLVIQSLWTPKDLGWWIYRPISQRIFFSIEISSSQIILGYVKLAQN